MTELASHIVERVIPLVPVRQWVLSLPHAFRYRLAYDHERMVAVFGLFVRAVLGFYARRAKARGLPGGQTGAVTFIQRFGWAANLHVHAHVLVMDGRLQVTAAHGAYPPLRTVGASSNRDLFVMPRMALRLGSRSGAQFLAMWHEVPVIPLLPLGKCAERDG